MTKIFRFPSTPERLEALLVNAWEEYSGIATKRAGVSPEDEKLAEAKFVSALEACVHNGSVPPSIEQLKMLEKIYQGIAIKVSNYRVRITDYIDPEKAADIKERLARREQPMPEGMREREALNLSRMFYLDRAP